MSGHKIGNYELDELLKSRSASNFYIGRDTKLDHPVFIEILRTTDEQDPGLVDQFQRRTETVSQLKNPQVASVIDAGVTEEGYPFAVLEFISGEWLSNKFAEWEQEEYILPVEDALLLARQIAVALSAAHSAGLVDPELRPENILISDADNRPIILDLVVPITVKARDSILNGHSNSLDYASPEEIEGKTISRRSNIYSIGIIIYELLTGHRPRLPTSSWDIFERSTMPKEVPLEEERQGLSGETYRLVRSCLWRQEWSRFESADELISAIDTAILAEQSLPKATLWTNNRRRWLYFAAPIVALLFIIFGLAVVWGQFANAEQGQANGSPTSVLEPTVDEANNALVGSGETPGPTATITREAPPTLDAAVTIPVFGPLADQTFTAADAIDFAWIWLTIPNDNEIFAVYVVAEDDGGDAIRVGTVDEPDNASLFLLEKSPEDIGIDAGSYLWQVRLEDRVSGDMIVESDPRRFIVAEEPTPTPTPTKTQTPSPTATLATPSATPTSEVCIPASPPGWISHRVQAGESIAVFGQRANVRVQDILDANCLSPGTVLSVGQLLYIPPPLATNTPTPSPFVPTPFDDGDVGGSPGGGNGGGNGGDNGGGDPPDEPDPTTPPTIPDP